MSLVCADRVDYTDIMRLHSWSAEILPIVAAACLLAVVPSAAIAADSSPWDNDLESAARLIAARAQAAPGGRVFRAGVEIKLKPGWKTYWRYPGDSGVPLVLSAPDSAAGKELRAIADALSSRKRGLAGMSLGLDPAGR